MKELHGLPVSVTIPADAAFVHVLRSVAAGVAARLDLSYDAIEDLRIAVDEACAQLLALAPAGALMLRLTPTEEGVEASVWAGRSDAQWPPPNAEGSLTWKVLSGLTDDASFDREEGSPALRFTKRRAEGAG